MTNKTTIHSLVAGFLAILLSFAMLLGLTYAYFTNTVSSNGNVIKSGTLSVGFSCANGTEDPATATWTDASAGAAFHYEKWESGYTEAKHLKIENTGTLALRYEFAIIPQGAVSKLADVIDVYRTTPATKQDASQALGTRVGTLTEFIDTGIPAGHLLAGESFSTTLVFKMHEEVSAGQTGLSTGTSFTILVITMPYTYEKDSFDDQYDKNVPYQVDTYADFVAAASRGGTIKLTDDIYVEGATTVLSEDVTIDLNGKSITGARDGSGKATQAILWVSGAEVTFIGEGTVENTATSGEYNPAIYIDGGGAVIIEDGTYIGDEHAVYVQNGEAIIKGGFFEAHKATSPVPVDDKDWQGVTYYCYLAAVVNCSKGSYNNYRYQRDGEKANVIISGGTFVNEDVSNLFEGDFIEVSHVLDGYKVIRTERENGDAWYTVVPE